jgi:S-formylglutathione hydrolase FrmB
VLVDVGDQDAIFNLTNNLLKILDEYQVPYILNRGPGGHTWGYWSSMMESYLLWFTEAWK